MSGRAWKFGDTYRLTDQPSTVSVAYSHVLVVRSAHSLTQLARFSSVSLSLRARERVDSTKTRFVVVSIFRSAFSPTDDMVPPPAAVDIDLSDTSSESGSSSTSYSESESTTLSSVSSLPLDVDSARLNSLVSISDRVCGVFHGQIAVLNNLVLVGFGSPEMLNPGPVIVSSSSSSDSDGGSSDGASIVTASTACCCENCEAACCCNQQNGSCDAGQQNGYMKPSPPQ